MKSHELVRSRRRADSRASVPVLLAALALLFGSACERIVPSGEELVIADGQTVFGSSGNDPRVAQPAVLVQPQGRLIVRDATLIGGTLLLQTVPAGSSRVAPAGILSLGGQVRVTSGAVVTGGLASVDGSVDATLASGSGIEAQGGSVSIEAGATVVGGDLGRPDTEMPVTLGGSGVRILNGTLSVSGGRIQGGIDFFSDAAPSIEAFGSIVRVQGGEIDLLQASSSTTRIVGGLVRRLAPSGGCTEIRGGATSSLSPSDGAVTRIFGSGFNAPLGEVNLSGLGFPPVLRGTLESGEPLDLSLPFALGLPGAAFPRVILQAAGEPGCP